MKRLLCSVSLLTVSAFSSAQNSVSQTPEIVAREMKSHLGRMAAGNVNPNTLNYDLRYQRLDLTLDPAVFHVGGSVTSHFLPNQNINRIYFDLSSLLTVSDVKYRGNTVPFTQLSTDEVRIDLPNYISSNVLDSLTIHYSGAPNLNNKAFQTSTQNGVPVLFTLNEPYGAQDWFPTKQSMNDKIERVDFKINTPSTYSVAANGVMMSETTPSAGRKLTFWRTNYPTAAYLVALSITDFTKLTDTIGNPPFPFINYLYPTSANDAAVMNNINWTKDAMTLFENRFGPYPFRNEKYGHMEFSYIGVCMEHQTMSSMSGWGRYVIAHELAHQWFGDKITCGTWNDIWLHEGFATYGEHLVNQHLLMTPADFQNYLNGQRNYICSAPNGAVYVPNSNLGGMSTIFNGRLVYAKGGYVVRMLHWVLGDTVFNSAIQDYLNRPNLAYNYAVTSDLKTSLLQSTGTDYTEFFNDWIYGEGYPTYNVTWAQNQTTNQLVLNVNQTQSDPSVSFFEMPLPIRVNGTGGQVEYLRFNNSANNQTFTAMVNFPIASVDFNYELQILEKNSTVTHNPVLATQEVNDNSAVILAQNPVKDYLILKGLKKSSSYEIFNAEGRLVMSGTIKPNEAIGIQKLVTGNYVLKLAESSYKFIKK